MSVRRDAPRAPVAPPELGFLQPGDSLLQRARRAQYKCLAPFSAAPTAEYTCVPIFCSETSVRPCTLPAQNGFALRLLPYDSAQAAAERRRQLLVRAVTVFAT